MPQFAAQFRNKDVRDPFKLGEDIDAVSRATITMSSAVRSIRNASRRVARTLLTTARGRQAVNTRALLRVLLPVVLVFAGAGLKTGGYMEAAAGLKTGGYGGGVVLAQAEQPPAGGWDFPDEEEEEAPTWGDDLRAQALDLGLVSAFLVLAFVSFFRKSVALKYVTLVAAVAFLGVSKSLLISIVNVFALLGGNLPIFRPNLAWYLLAVVTVGSTILWGRVYCGRICAFGAFTQLVDAVVPDRWKWNVPRALEKRASWIKYGILGGALAYFLASRTPLILSVHRTVSGCSACTCARRCCWRCSARLLIASIFVRNPLLPLSVSARRVPRRAVEPDGVPHQAVVRSATPARSVRRRASGAPSKGRRS
jgi:hypothetical protein